MRNSVAWRDDAPLLQPGSRCIIHFGSGGFEAPVGWWWGKVLETSPPKDPERDRIFYTQAVIAGGPVSFHAVLGRYEPIYSNLRDGYESSQDCWVYPDTNGVRSLVQQLMENERTSSATIANLRQLDKHWEHIFKVLAGGGAGAATNAVVALGRLLSAVEQVVTVAPESSLELPIRVARVISVLRDELAALKAL